jgi:hypothetical protein
MLSSRFIAAVAQLAGVDESQVTLLPLPDTPGVLAESLTALDPVSVTNNVSNSHSNLVTAGGSSGMPRIAASAASQAGSGALEVTCSIQTRSAAEASHVISNVSDVARQAQFAKQLSDAGLQLVLGSVSWLTLNPVSQAGSSSSCMRRVQSVAVVVLVGAATMLLLVLA